MKIPDKRSRILQVAMELIAENGFHCAPMAEIAERAGVAAGTIYRYFENKDVLIVILNRELEEKINARLRENYPAEAPLRDRFVYMIRELLRYFIANPLHFRYMEQYYNSPYGISKKKERLSNDSGKPGIARDMFAEGTKQQVLMDLPSLVLSAFAFGPILSLLRDHILGFIRLDEPLIGQIAEACWDSIKK